MIEQTYTVKLDSGIVGQLKTRLKSRELVGRVALVQADVDGETDYFSGIVAHVYEQQELEL